MKKAFLILIGLLTVVSIFATDSEVTSLATSSTTVKLSLEGDYATVWFSKEAANTEAISEYALSLKNPGSLKQDTSGNGGQDDNIYAGSDESAENGLFINWNIISASNVLITLKIDTPLKQADAKDVNQKIGWKASWKYTASNDSNGSDKSIYLADSATDSDEDSANVYLKNGSIYGEGGSKQITIVTDNVWGKNKTKEYSAVLYAEITTT